MDPATTPLGFALSKWFLLVQGGAVVVAIVLSAVLYRLWGDYKEQRDKTEKLLEDRIEEARDDITTEKATTATMVTAISENTAERKTTNTRLAAIERKLGMEP